MRTKTITNAIIINAKSVEELNALIAVELKGKNNPTVEPVPAWGFCVWVKWEEDMAVPEDALEKKEVQHGHHTCMDCPMLNVSTDKRKRWHKCINTGDERHEHHPACMEFYKLIEEGGAYDQRPMEKRS